uniref:Orf protein n=1 Tax=Saccharomyces cerevisiae TaxID=4932 RepID=E9PA89_YEASX|nr:orf [Saccharomyces cerevisiae]
MLGRLSRNPILSPSFNGEPFSRTQFNFPSWIDSNEMSLIPYPYTSNPTGASKLASLLQTPNRRCGVSFTCLCIFSYMPLCTSSTESSAFSLLLTPSANFLFPPRITSTSQYVIPSLIHTSLLAVLQPY